MYVYNPSNFSVSYAASAGSATTAGYATTAGALTSMNISQFTNNSGYITSSSLSGLVPYTGATGNVDLGIRNITAAAFFETSDIRFKNVLETNPSIDLPLDVIKFTRIDENSDAIRYGYSAQQVQSYLPDAVSGSEKLSVNYMDVHTLKIAALEKRIAELEAKLK
jgi:hypothetical protein